MNTLNIPEDIYKQLSEIIKEWEELEPVKVMCDIPYIKSYLEIVLANAGYITTECDTPTIILKISGKDVEFENTSDNFIISVEIKDLKKLLESKHNLKSILISNSEVHIVQNLGRPIFFLDSDTSFSQDGSERFYSSRTVEVYKNYYVKEKTFEFKSSLLTRLDNFLLFTDGSISDVNLTWNLRIGNAPLDFLIWKNRFYFLDIAGVLTVVDLRTRNTLLKKIYPGVNRIAIQNNSVYLFRKFDAIILDEKNSERIEKNIELNEYQNHLVYPSFMGIYKIDDYYITDRGIPLGKELKNFFVETNNLVVVTEVGRWNIKIKE